MELGKKKCEVLKEVRKKIADANGIEYTPEQCNHKGDCKGTCPKCEQEVRYIENQLNLRKKLGKAVVIAGTAIGIAAVGTASTSCSCSTMHTTGIIPAQVDGIVPAKDSIDTTRKANCVKPDSTEEIYELEGDVPAPMKEEDEQPNPTPQKSK